MPFNSAAYLMNTSGNINRRIDAVRIVLAEYFNKSEDGHLRNVEILSINLEDFSTIIHISIQTSRETKRYVIKTINHHPDNEAIIDFETQAVMEYDILRYLYPKFQNIERCSVPRPILVIPEMETYVMEFVEGGSLSSEFKFARYFSPQDKFQSLKKCYYDCGRWLRHFQKFTGVHVGGPEILDGVIDRCNFRLKLIEDLKDDRCPKNLRHQTMESLHDEHSKLSEDIIFCSGRHGDFGAWNILVGSHGITVIDFLGYGQDPVAVDILKMLMNFEDEKKYLAYNSYRIDTLRKSFLDGFGPLPFVPMPVLTICEAYHRICSVLACLSSKEKRIHRRIERSRCLKANLEWLTNERRRKLLWPNGDHQY